MSLRCTWHRQGSQGSLGPVILKSLPCPGDVGDFCLRSRECRHSGPPGVTVSEWVGVPPPQSPSVDVAVHLGATCPIASVSQHQWRGRVRCLAGAGPLAASPELYARLPPFSAGSPAAGAHTARGTQTDSHSGCWPRPLTCDPSAQEARPGPARVTVSWSLHSLQFS